MNRRSELVEKYYRGYHEWNRLDSDSYHALEYETTLHFLAKHLPDRGRILDAGGGPGRYTIELARRGYSAVLVDLSSEQVRIARREIRKAGVANRVTGAYRGSVSDLSRFRDRSFDAVLCLGGVLGHVGNRRARAKAIRELARVAKRRAPVFVSVMGRYSQFFDHAGHFPDLASEPEFYRAALVKGDYDGSHGFAPCHFFLPDELESELYENGLRVVERAALEGLASYHSREVNRLSKTEPAAGTLWKEIHLRTCTRPEVVAMSEHFLMVARTR